MKPHEIRLLIECEDLDRKIIKLACFINVPNSDFDRLEGFDKALLKQQLDAMQIYRDILNDRIKRIFKNA
jgi:hypothetical protein